jgi:hypothetical protein
MIPTSLRPSLSASCPDDKVPTGKTGQRVENPNATGYATAPAGLQFVAIRDNRSTENVGRFAAPP